MVITAGILWRFGFRAVWAAGLIWGLVYMREGAAMTLQRDYLAVFPMALGLGEAGEQNAPLGRAVIGGLAAATFATLVLVPIFYTLLRKKPPQLHMLDQKFDLALNQTEGTKAHG